MKLWNQSWVATGVVGGTILGGIANVWKTGSLFSKDPAGCLDPFNGFQPLAVINQVRNQALMPFAGYSATDVLFNRFFPMVYIAPVIGFNLWNLMRDRNQVHSKNQSFISNEWERVSRSVFYPLLDNISLIGLSNLTRRFYKKIGSPEVDTSGHVMVQGGLTIFAMNMLSKVSETGTESQKKLFTIICAIVACTDGIFMYNTTASCHSIADVVAGVAVVAVGYLGVQFARSIVSAYRV